MDVVMSVCTDSEALRPFYISPQKGGASLKLGSLIGSIGSTADLLRMENHAVMICNETPATLHMAR